MYNLLDNYDNYTRITGFYRFLCCTKGKVVYNYLKTSVETIYQLPRRALYPQLQYISL